MLTRIKNWFFPTAQQDTMQTQSPETSQGIVLSPENREDGQEMTWVYVWKTTPRNIGHAALQVGGSKPKISVEDAGDYISLWPNGIPAMGPATVLPLPAGLADTLTSDMQCEDEQNRTTFLTDPEYNTLDTQQLVNPDGVAPTKIYKIPGLNTNAMRNKIVSIKDSVETGEQRYQLFPNINLLSFFIDAGANLSYDSVDTSQLNQNESRRKLHSSYSANNCTTLVSDILKEGGLSIKTTNMPMGLTPNSLSKQLESCESYTKSLRMSE